MLCDPPKPEHGHDGKPQRHDRAEAPADPGHTQRLVGKERNQDRHCSWQDVRVESRRDDVEHFQRRKDRDGWREPSP